MVSWKLLVATALLALLFASMWLTTMSELKKKFFYLRQHYAVSETTTARFVWPGAEEFGTSPGMRKIILRGDRPFHALVGFDLTAPLLGTGLDVYGFVSSRPTNDPQVHAAVLNTYLGNGGTVFRFFVNREAGDITVTSVDEDQPLNADATYPKHWWQVGPFS